MWFLESVLDYMYTLWRDAALWVVGGAMDGAVDGAISMDEQVTLRWRRESVGWCHAMPCRGQSCPFYNAHDAALSSFMKVS
jgi:hypothetical protein